MTLVLSKDKNYLEYIWNGIDSISSIKALTKINQNDNRKLLGYNLYTKEHLDILKTKKPIEEMTIEDFKKYLVMFYENLTTEAIEYKKYAKGGYYSAYQVGLKTLLKMNYNPIQNSDTLNSMFEKFIKKDEIIEFMKALKEK